MHKKRKKRIQIPTLEQIEAERRRLKYRSRYNRTLKNTVAVLIVVAAIAVLIATLWIPVLRIYGSSMSPTLKNGQIVLSIKNSRFSTGDIVAFYYGNKLLVKRCIAGPSDWVDIDEEGNIYVNGQLLDEPYINKKDFGETTINLPYQVPDKRWFLVGDNRDVSVDSRSTSVGCVSDEQIVGKIVFCVWPISQFGTLD